MIAVTHNVVKVGPFLEEGSQPAAILKREPADCWYVRSMPFCTPGHAAWEWCLEGKVMRVPLFPHLINSTDPEFAIAFGIQLGLQAMEEVAGGEQIVRVHLAVGFPTEDLGDRLRYWVGMAFLLRRSPG